MPSSGAWAGGDARKRRMELDAVDKRILRAVQARCTLNADELAEASGVSPSTALRRLKRLRDARVITAEVAVLDPKQVGRPLQMIVAVRLERDDGRAVRGFIMEMQKHPAVTQCYFVTGSADYMLHLTVADMDEFNTFVERQLIANPHVASTDTHVVINPIKVGLAVPIAD